MVSKVLQLRWAGQGPTVTSAAPGRITVFRLIFDSSDVAYPPLPSTHRPGHTLADTQYGGT